MTEPLVKHEIKLIVGLGNPGPQYAGTRHNIGFDVVESAKNHYQLDNWVKKFRSEYSRGLIHNQQIICLKPMTYMNLSGKAVMECMQFFKIKPENMLVVHDDLDLSLAKVKVKLGGGNAGHNGLRSIDETIANNQYYRLRVGIGRPERREVVSDYVLTRFNADDQQTMHSKIHAIVSQLALLLQKEYERFIAAVNNDSDAG